MVEKESYCYLSSYPVFIIPFNISYTFALFYFVNSTTSLEFTSNLVHSHWLVVITDCIASYLRLCVGSRYSILRCFFPKGTLNLLYMWLYKLSNLQLSRRASLGLGLSNQCSCIKPHQWKKIEPLKNATFNKIRKFQYIRDATFWKLYIRPLWP